MSKNAITIAEVFVVLALIFLVQSVVNFSLVTEGASDDVDLPAFFVARVSQEPAGSSNFDHLEYIVIGSENPRCFKSCKVWKLDHKFENGTWKPYGEYSGWDLTSTKLVSTELLSKAFHERYGASLDITEVFGQKVISISYGPKDLAMEVELRLGFSACELGSSIAHPVVVQLTSCRAGLETLEEKTTFSESADFVVSGKLTKPLSKNLRVLSQGIPSDSEDLGKGKVVGEVILRLTNNGVVFVKNEGV